MTIFKKVVKVSIVVMLVIVCVAILFINFWEPFGQQATSKEQQLYSQKSELFDGKTFHDNPEISVMNEQESEFSDHEETIPKGKIPVHYLDSIPEAPVDDLQWIWLGHSSSLLQMQGVNILIDPVFSEYTSPVQGFGAKRFSDLPIPKEQFSNIDILVISHDHYDHLDYETIKEIDDKVKSYCVPLGVEKHLLRWGVDKNKIHSMAWWEEVKIQGVSITATPGRHYTGRLPWQTNTTLWSGYVFQNEKYTSYYTGDTGYSNYFKEVYDKFGAMDFVMLENGQYDRSWQEIHLLPTQGIQAIKDLHAKWVVPVHWGTFSISYHAWDDPIKQITSLAKKENINIATPMIGEIVNYQTIFQFQKKWWDEVE